MRRGRAFPAESGRRGLAELLHKEKSQWLVSSRALPTLLPFREFETGEGIDAVAGRRWSTLCDPAFRPIAPADGHTRVFSGYWGSSQISLESHILSANFPSVEKCANRSRSSRVNKENKGNGDKMG